MLPEHNEVDKFFAELPGEDKQVADIFAPEVPAGGEQGANPENGSATLPPETEEEKVLKNRRILRLQSKLDREIEEHQREREERLRTEARLDAIASGKDQNLSVDERLTRLYGADNPEAARLHMELLRDVETKAEERAVQRMQEARHQEAEEQSRNESIITQELEALEDTDSNVDLTSNAPKARKLRAELLDLVGKLSPKDEQGNIIAYAPFDQAWDILKSRPAATAPGAQRAKGISGLSMTRGGVGTPAPKVPTPGFDGWKRDLGIG